MLRTIAGWLFVPDPALVAVLLVLPIMSVAAASAQQDEAAITRGAAYLRGRAANLMVGETAMVALGLLKSGAPASDPVVAKCLDKICTRITATGYLPERGSGGGIYEAAVVAMALANAEEAESRAKIVPIAAHLIGRQKPNGSWDYDNRAVGDTSITQYALLGLWECANSGAYVPPSVWDRAAAWYLSVQRSSGGWSYHPDEVTYSEWISATAAGVGSLLLCDRQLAAHLHGLENISPLLIRLTGEERDRDYKRIVPRGQIERGVRMGMEWLNGKFDPSNGAIVGVSAYYSLYGIERMWAFADRRMLGNSDLFERARSFVLSTQNPDGSWASQAVSQEVNTVWAILLLTRSTAKSIQRARQRLGGGTLIGGRYLPTDLTTVTVAAGRIVSRPMNGAAEEMIKALEDNRVQSADRAVLGLEKRYYQEGPDVLRPYKDRFRRMLSSRDPGLREVAAWALGRTGDLDVVPDLIGALTDREESVVVAARTGLQLLSRKIDGHGPANPSAAEERKKAAQAWQHWYDLIRPLGKEADDDTSRLGRTRPDAQFTAPALPGSNR
ncbi:MAG: HEAT repeat domain-containing protein [Isosphaeraceae bacterium]